MLWLIFSNKKRSKNQMVYENMARAGTSCERKRRRNIYEDVTKTGNGERGTGNGERGTGNGERGTGNGERGTGNGSLGTSVQR